jgi:predicted enzyme related to lactoylglutathione lyase
MNHLANWIEIPVSNMKRAVSFYGELLNLELNEMKLGPNDYALFGVKDTFNTGALVQGDGYVPNTNGTIVYLNGGKDLSEVLARVESAGGQVLLDKTFLSKEAGYVGYFTDTEGNKIGVHSMN